MVKMKKSVLAILLVLALLLGFGGAAGLYFLDLYGYINISDSVAVEKDWYGTLVYYYNNYAKTEMLRQYILENYYTEVDPDDVEYGMYQGMFLSLEDVYTYYMDESEYQNLLISSTGNYSGVGITMTADTQSGYVVVHALTEGAPAEAAGVKLGDYIYKVDGVAYTASEMDQCAAAVRGTAGTKVTITMIRDGKEMDFTITRQQILSKTVSSKMLEDGIGYIKISSFEEPTAKDFSEALDSIEKQGAKKFVLDLRGNPGGLVDIGQLIANDLMDQGTLVYTEDQKGNRDYLNTTPGRTKLEYVVLIDENSASCAEILAAGIQDNDEGKLVGTTSYGKGIIQSMVQLYDGTAVKMTVLQYFSPNGNQIHKQGVTPDYVVELDESCYNEKGELINDKQLEKALQLLKN